MTDLNERSHKIFRFHRGREKRIEEMIDTEIVQRLDRLDQRLTTINEALEDIAGHCARVANHCDRMDKTMSLLISSLKERLTKTEESGDMLRTILGLVFSKR